MFERRVDVVQRALDHTLEQMGRPDVWRGPADPLRSGSRLLAAEAVALFTDMVRSREIDVAARDLKTSGRSFYTISSAGHEMNAVVGALTRVGDPAFLHYRSGGFMMARSRQEPSVDPVRDSMLSIVASADDPISQGRHKVWGSRALWVPPQTSTIASHLPKAMGTAFSLHRARRLGLAGELPDDTLVVCSFGDASANHATALAGINSARYAHRRGNPMPILFVCEDNGIGISVDTPKGWIADTFGSSSHLHYVRAEGEVDEVWDTVAGAVDRCRTSRAPVFLHLPVVRLWGHAGSDVETAYRGRDAITSDEARDPLIAVARRLVATGAADPRTLRQIVEDVRGEVRCATEQNLQRGHLADRGAVMDALAPYDERAVRADAEAAGAPEALARRRDRRGGHDGARRSRAPR
jgi:2-oxoisovalerate dehydrogenase E1 component